MLFFGEGQKRDKRTNGQTHIGGWVENVTNGQTHSKNRDTRTDTHTESCFLRKDELQNNYSIHLYKIETFSMLVALILFFSWISFAIWRVMKSTSSKNLKRQGQEKKVIHLLFL